MPAPPYAAGTETPSNPSSPILGSTLRSKRWLRSSSRIFGAISRTAHSRTDCSSIFCSPVRSKFIEIEIEGIVARTTQRSPASAFLDGDVCATTEGKAIARVPGAHRNLEMIRAAEQRTQLARRRFGVGCDHLRDRMRADGNFDGARPPRKPVEALVVDVGHEVAESIDAQDFPADRVVADARLWNGESMVIGRRPSERRQVHSLGHPARRRREPIAPLEGPADGRPGVPALGELDD